MRKVHIDLREIHLIGQDTREWIVPKGASKQMAAYDMRTVGYSDCGRGYRMMRPTPDFVHVLVCTGGAGRVLIDGHWETCSEGMAYLAPPGPAHGFETIAGRRWKMSWMYYGAPIDRPPLIAGAKPLLLHVDHRPIELALKGLYLEYATTAAPATMARWIDLLHGYAMAMTRPVAAYDRLWRLWERVNSDLSTAWTLPDLADVAAVGPEQLRRLCLASLDRSPMQHVTHLRMRKAAALLSSTPMKIAAIAQLVGYQNAFAFSNTFRRVMGRPPSAFRATSSPSTNPPAR